MPPRCRCGAGNYRKHPSADPAHFPEPTNPVEGVPLSASRLGGRYPIGWLAGKRDPVCVWSNVPGEASEVPATPMDAGMLRPYISALVIQYTGTMLDKALDVLRTQIEKSVNRHRGTVAIVATDLEGA